MRARGKVGLYFITGIKETQNGTRAAPAAHARSYHLISHTARLNEAPEGRAGPAEDLNRPDSSRSKTGPRNLGSGVYRN